ncbi:MAG: Tetracenomycin cyclase [Amycolatopsis sp.]|uniref:TcmI family type II polyketide cyclase n=1 Tax=Amycolatopsis sp. TaxID=37632 RepID=UPI0026059E23|nr:TcmI family type II polyketide cyclase [Amycolatopsis sp.]MCU1686716.1 Tetracenomycin cyclase [Amycolatopsis sp.]
MTEQHRTLIVARADRRSLADIGRIFAESDDTGLPHRLGVRRRSLFHFRELYFHLIDADAPVLGPLEQMRDDPDFRSVNERLARFVTPYSPEWRSPGDAMANEFYTWSSGECPWEGER